MAHSVRINLVKCIPLYILKIKYYDEVFFEKGLNVIFCMLMKCPSYNFNFFNLEFVYSQSIALLNCTSDRVPSQLSESKIVSIASVDVNSILLYYNYEGQFCDKYKSLK